MLDLFTEKLKTNPTTRVFIVGLPLSGKTTLGKQLAQHLCIPFYDLDEQICSVRSVKDVAAFFTLYGEQIFRTQEHSILEQFLQKPGPYVLATGGGTACKQNHMYAMNQAGHTLYIYLSWQDLAKRVRSLSSASRPLLREVPASAEALASRFSKRLTYYEQAQTTYQSTIENLKQ